MNAYGFLFMFQNKHNNCLDTCNKSDNLAIYEQVAEDKSCCKCILTVRYSRLNKAAVHCLSRNDSKLHFRITFYILEGGNKGTGYPLGTFKIIT